ncbi:TSCPD domain-containing protein [Geoalkalibacter halelectricus]|uniref:TSCPD domain-containing protein n=1 Tax=Geoalkalibacter halelectricus TaxID=2847045 RepID=UPI00266E9CDC|nr:TSCPD domain-containing protein [Geoalkalibacter halelectricus]MDO3380427.1 TSCPD domain-containing protein [Geoalkalibacter halelectricus]
MTPKKLRPKAVRGQTFEMPAPCGRLYVTFNNDPDTGKLMEIFVRFGKSGTCASVVANCTTMAVSKGLRSGLDPLDALKCFVGHSCHRPPAFDNGTMILSCMDAIGKALREHMGLEDEIEDKPIGGDDDYQEAQLVRYAG